MPRRSVKYWDSRQHRAVIPKPLSRKAPSLPEPYPPGVSANKSCILGPKLRKEASDEEKKQSVDSTVLQIAPFLLSIGLTYENQSVESRPSYREQHQVPRDGEFEQTRLVTKYGAKCNKAGCDKRSKEGIPIGTKAYIRYRSKTSESVECTFCSRECCAESDRVHRAAQKRKRELDLPSSFCYEDDLSLGSSEQEFVFVPAQDFNMHRKKFDQMEEEYGAAAVSDWLYQEHLCYKKRVEVA